MSSTPSRSAISSISLLALLAAVALSLGFGSCGWPPFHFHSPLPRQLSLIGEIGFELRLPPRAVSESLEVRLVDPDGVATPVSGVVIDGGRGPGSATGSVAIGEAGDYRLEAEVEMRIFLFFTRHLTTAASFETVELRNPDQCEILNDVECLLPYPSSRFLVEDASTESGYRLDVPQVGIPQPNGAPIPNAMLNQLDGFSPTVQVVMHFPGGVSVEQSDASRLLPPECCGQPAGPPWIETRTHDDRSLDPDSPTVLLDWDTGERILHWIEVDARAEGNPERQALILRPALSLTPGHRYIVAVRDLVREDGTAVEAEPAFAALRDGRPTDIPALAERRPQMRKVFRRLRRAGVRRSELILAFDFVVQSEHQLTHQMLTMRDKAFEWLDAQDQSASPTFQVVTVEEYDCSDPSQAHRRIVEGTFQSPLFLEDIPGGNTPRLYVDPATDEPLINESIPTMDAPFTVSIPCALVEEDGPEIYTLLLGHGIFGTGEGMVRWVPSGATEVLAQFPGSQRWRYIAGATDWSGWSQPEAFWVGFHIIGFFQSQLHNWEAFPDRHRQGQVNTLILSRMMKRGDFNVDPAFQLDLGSGPEAVFPGEDTEQYYYGISMGGVQGLFHSALSPDIEKFGIDVGSINFSMLLQRSTVFDSPGSALSFKALLDNIGLADPLTQLLGIGLLHEVWVGADPSGYATHITSDPLPGSIAKKILLTPAWLDHQVSNQGTEITARTLGVKSLHGSLQRELVGVPDAAPGEVLDSALVMYGTGLDILNPDHRPVIPPLANQIIEDDRCDPHGARPAIPAGMEQLLTFLQPGGSIENFCDGICDADGPWEIAEGAAAPCDPLN